MNNPRSGKPAARKQQNVEAQTEDLGVPRLIARIWGLVAGVSYVSNGGYLLTQSTGDSKCQGAGGYMLVIGLLIILQEFGCCLCPAKGSCCDKFEAKFPFWARSLAYFASVIPPLALCFHMKTAISTVILIVQGLVYASLHCLVKNKKYERLREASKVELQRRKNEAAGYGSVLSMGNNAMSFIKESTAAASKQQQQPRAKGAPRNTKR